jgi:hypothetical protein
VNLTSIKKIYVGLCGTTKNVVEALTNQKAAVMMLKVARTDVMQDVKNAKTMIQNVTKLAKADARDKND